MKNIILEDYQLKFRLYASLKKKEGTRRFQVRIVSNIVLGDEPIIHWFEADSWKQAERYADNMLLVIRAITRVSSGLNADLPRELAMLEKEIPKWISFLKRPNRNSYNRLTTALATPLLTP